MFRSVRQTGTMAALVMLAALLLVLSDAPARAAGSSAILYNTTKNDGGFNESAFEAVKRFHEETGVRLREQVTHSAEQSLQAVRVYAQRGIDHIILIGFLNEPVVKSAAVEFPETRFTLIDGFVEAPNVRAVLFREDEAAFLAGIAAGLKTRTGTVGFIGGMPIPPVRRFGCGFLQGVTHANPQATVLRTYLGDRPAVFRDRDLGREAAERQLAEGADVIFAAAGFAGLGALDAVAEAGKLGIGVDVNQDGYKPGHVLTSAVKRVDTAVYRALTDLHNDAWTGGVQRLGIAEGGVGWTVDAHNRALVADIQEQVDAVKTAVADGTLEVRDYPAVAACALP